MKLRELIDNVDRSKTNTSHVSLDEMATEFDLSLDYVPEDRHPIRAYWLTKWLCTDSWVGLRVYGFEDDQGFSPFAVSMQEGRKCDEVFHWFRQAAADRVRELITSFIEIPRVDVLDEGALDDDMGDGFKVSYSGQLLTKQVIEDATGERVEVVKTFRGMDDIKKWGRVVIERASGEQAEVDMREISVPFCLAPASA